MAALGTEAPTQGVTVTYKEVSLPALQGVSQRLLLILMVHLPSPASLPDLL